MLSVEHFKIPNNSFLETFFVKLRRKGWEDYVSLYKHPELFKCLIKDNPLLVVHPGLIKYWPKEDKSNIDFDKYREYLKRVKEKVENTLEEGRSVLVFTPVDYKEETLSALGYAKGIILIPTLKNGLKTDDFLMRDEGASFLEALAVNIEKAEICGELRGRCILAVINKIYEHGAEVTPIENCIFPSKE